MIHAEIWLAGAVALFLVASLLLYRTIRSLLRALRGSIVAALPLRPEQAVALPCAGTYDLYIEGALFSTDFGKLEFTLADPAGTPLRLRRVIFRTTVSGLRRLRMRLRSFDAPLPGSYTLRLDGIRPNQDPANRILFATPVTAKVIGRILAIAALGFLVMASLGGVLVTQLQ